MKPYHVSLVFSLTTILLCAVAWEMNKVSRFLPPEIEWAVEERLQQLWIKFFWCRLLGYALWGELMAPHKIRRLVEHLRLHRKATVARKKFEEECDAWRRLLSCITASPYELETERRRVIDQALGDKSHVPSVRGSLSSGYDEENLEAVIRLAEYRLALFAPAQAEMNELVRAWARQKRTETLTLLMEMKEEIPSHSEDEWTARYVRDQIEKERLEFLLETDRLLTSTHPATEAECVRAVERKLQHLAWYRTSNPYERIRTIRANRASTPSLDPS